MIKCYSVLILAAVIVCMTGCCGLECNKFEISEHSGEPLAVVRSQPPVVYPSEVGKNYGSHALRGLHSIKMLALHYQNGDFNGTDSEVAVVEDILRELLNTKVYSQVSVSGYVSHRINPELVNKMYFPDIVFGAKSDMHAVYVNSEGDVYIVQQFIIGGESASE